MEILCKTLEELNTAAQNQDPELIITLDFPRENIIPELPHINGRYKLIGNTTVAKVTGTTIICEMTANSIVQNMHDNSTVEAMDYYSTVQNMHDNSIVHKMWDNSRVYTMYHSCLVHNMRGYSTVHSMWYTSTVRNMHDNSIVKNIHDNSTIQNMHHNSIVQRMWENSAVQSMWDNSIVQKMYHSSTVQSTWENSHVHINSRDVIINAYHQTLITSAIPIEQLQNVSKHDEAVLIHRPLFKHNQTTFSQVYQANLVDEETIRLYKSVKEDHTDFWTGRIKYEGTVESPDWDPNPERQCGGGLHLSPTPELALEYNQGKVLECHVKLEDMVVYPYDVTKVRCRKVEVVGETS